MDKQTINTSNAPAPIGPYSQAVKAGGFLYISGQIALNPATSELIIGTITEETEQVMNNLKAILESAGLGFSNVIKTSIFLSDMELFANVNEVYGKFFDTDYPARETIAAKGLPKNVNVEISMIALE
jgi:2-iminobutanoate/2-iminopropanoate deaminase